MDISLLPVKYTGNILCHYWICSITLYSDYLSTKKKGGGLNMVILWKQFDQGKIDLDYHLSNFMQTVSIYAASRDAIVCERPATLLAHSELVAVKLPRTLPQELLESQVLAVLLILMTESLTAKWGLHQTGSTGWFLRERETWRERRHERSEEQRCCIKHFICIPLGNKNPEEKLYIQHNICSQLTYGSLLKFLKTNKQRENELCSQFLQETLKISSAKQKNAKLKLCARGPISLEPPFPSPSPNPHFWEVILISRLSWWLSLLLHRQEGSWLPWTHSSCKGTLLCRKMHNTELAPPWDLALMLFYHPHQPPVHPFVFGISCTWQSAASSHCGSSMPASSVVGFDLWHQDLEILAMMDLLECTANTLCFGNCFILNYPGHWEIALRAVFWSCIDWGLGESGSRQLIGKVIGGLSPLWSQKLSPIAPNSVFGLYVWLLLFGASKYRHCFSKTMNNRSQF